MELSELGHQPLASDWAGVNLLYWSRAGRQFVFGSEVPALLEHPSVRRTIDEESPLVAAGLTSSEVVRGFVGEHFGRRGLYGWVQCALFCLTLWYRLWLLGERGIPA